MPFDKPMTVAHCSASSHVVNSGRSRMSRDSSSIVLIWEWIYNRQAWLSISYSWCAPAVSLTRSDSLTKGVFLKYPVKSPFDPPPPPPPPPHTHTHTHTHLIRRFVQHYWLFLKISLAREYLGKNLSKSRKNGQTIKKSSLCMYWTMSSEVNPDSKVHGANMGPNWVLSAPDRPHVGPMNLAIREGTGVHTPSFLPTGQC